jgi:hypothetical protein
MSDPHRTFVPDRFNDLALMQAAVARGVRRALEQHARNGDAVAVWREGKVVWVPAADLLAELPPEPKNGNPPPPQDSLTPRNGP